MSRRTGALLPIPKLLRPVVQQGTYQKLLANKKKDLGALRSGDTVLFVTQGNSSKEAVKPKVERCVGTRYFEVGTEDGDRYRRNRRHLRKAKEACGSPKPGLVAEEGAEQPNQQTMSLPEQAQTSHELTASCMQTNVPSGQADATNKPAMKSRQPEPRRVQPVALPVQG